MSSSSGKETPRRFKRERSPSNNYNEFRVEIPEYDGKLDPDEFLEWLNTVERTFEYKEIPKHKKVKFIALKLKKYASPLVD